MRSLEREGLEHQVATRNTRRGGPDQNLRIEQIRVALSDESLKKLNLELDQVQQQLHDEHDMKSPNFYTLTVVVSSRPNETEL